MMEATAGESIRSPLYAVHEALGARFMEDGGWFWTEGFGDLDAEYRGVRDGVAVWDVSPLNKWEFTGPDALEAAARLHTNRIRGLKSGQVRYGALCDSDGLMVDDGTVFKFTDDHVWVMTNGREHEEHFAAVTDGLEVAFEFIGRELPHIGLQGPRSREALAPHCSADIRTLPYFQFIPEQVKVAGVPCWVSRTGFGGELGYELFCRPEHIEDLWSVAVDRIGAKPYGVEAVEILRVESGLIVTNYDYQLHERSPYDFSFDRLVDFGNGDFNGKAALEAIAANPPRRFKTLRVEGGVLPEYGAAVIMDGEQVGTLTSPSRSPRFGMLGLAVLDAAVAENGTRLEVAVADHTVGATVDVLPIYDPEKRRPRS
jgi:aminomethyltransferase